MAAGKSPDSVTPRKNRATVRVAKFVVTPWRVMQVPNKMTRMAR